jgi:serine O-acetyltransferase
VKYSAALQRQPDADVAADALEATRAFGASLPQIRNLLDSDVLAAFQGDPAAGSVDEVLLCYPGVLAMIHYRLAHRLYELGLPLLARIISELAHGATGIDIHPGATIGAGGKLQKGLARHPIVEDNVVIYAGATILGRITLGKGAVIGGNVWLTHDVPAGGRIAQAASRED